MKQLGAITILTVMLLPFMAWTAVEVVGLGRDISRTKATVQNHKELADERTDRIYRKLEAMDKKLDRALGID